MQNVVISLVGLTLGLLTSAPPEALPLVADGRAVSRIVVLSEQPELRLAKMAVEAITGPVQRWSGVRLPVEKAASGGIETLFASPSIMLATLPDLQRHAPELLARHDLLLRLESLDEHGYILLPLERNGVRVLLLAGRTWRAVYNAATHVGECCIDGTARALSVNAREEVRAPHLRQRPVYVLTIWGEEDEYGVDDWMAVFDSLARDGATDLYFWLSGHFPSRLFPQTFKLADKDWDSTENTRIGTLDEQRQLIRRTHELGMKFFIGGALGAWCGSFNLTNREPGTMRTASRDESGQDVSEWSLCPASERSREALVAYYVEMFDALPEADGLYIESADEYGECACERCSRPVGSLGSRMFGQYQLTLVQRIMHEVWKRHPHARFCYTIGYSPHKSDPVYYEVVRQMSADPRIEWMEARDSWTLPGPDGEPRDPAWFSPRILRWEYFPTRPLEKLIAHTDKAARLGMSGYIGIFSPGFASGSFYHQVPYPTSALPHVLTQYVLREAAWQPTPHVDEMKARVARRFFGVDAPRELAEHLWTLRDILRAAAGKKISPQQLQDAAGIEAAVRQAHENAGPKTRETLDLMLTAIADVRRHCTVTTTKPK